MKLGFEKPSPSAIDSVSDRDYIGEMLHALALCMQHLSRLSQELVLWATPQFGYVRIADAYSTGSSLMPQKRNPDMAELIRGRAPEALGAYTSFMAMMQGLPLSYNRDMQDDKPGLFRVCAISLSSLGLLEAMLRTAEFDTDRMKRDADFPGATATDTADRLVAEGTPFRLAHEEVGKRVRDGSLEPIDAAESISGRASHGGVGDLSTQLAAAEALLTPSG
jgi:argininosuccinate lyase